MGPVESLYVFADETKLEERRELLSLRYYLKTRAQLSSPVGACISQQNQVLTTTASNKTFYSRIQSIIKKLRLPKFTIQPEFSYTGQQCNTPNYAQRKPTVNKELSRYPKDGTPPSVYLSEFAAIRDEKFSSFRKIYTDGSKTNTGVRAAAVSHDKCSTATLPVKASIFTAEAYALELALGIIERSNSRLNVVFSDSRSCIESLLYNGQHPTIRKLIWRLHKLAEKRTTVEICWIPSHVGIKGNERADQKAKDAAQREERTYLPIYYKDYYPTIGRKLYEAREEAVLNRIRAGHSRLTHGHLMESGPPPICPFCNNSILTINHIFVECNELANQRERHLGERSPQQLENAIGSGANINKIVEFLQNIQLYNQI